MEYELLEASLPKAWNEKFIICIKYIDVEGHVDISANPKVEITIHSRKDFEELKRYVVNIKQFASFLATDAGLVLTTLNVSYYIKYDSFSLIKLEPIGLGPISWTTSRLMIDYRGKEFLILNEKINVMHTVSSIGIGSKFRNLGKGMILYGENRKKDNFHYFDYTDGEKKWTFSYHGKMTSYATLDNIVVFQWLIEDGSRSPYWITGVNIDTGELLWERPIDFPGSLHVDDKRNSIFIMMYNQFIYISLESGKTSKVLNGSNLLKCSAIQRIEDDRAYYNTRDNKIACLDLVTDTILWAYDFVGQGVSMPGASPIITLKNGELLLNNSSTKVQLKFDPDDPENIKSRYMHNGQLMVQDSA